MSAFTPGPWCVGGGLWPDGQLWWVEDERAWRVTNATPCLPEPEAKANAHLMASAPDLLASLEELVASRKRRAGQNEDGSDGRYARARAAIAKAREVKP